MTKKEASLGDNWIGLYYMLGVVMRMRFAILFFVLSFFALHVHASECERILLFDTDIQVVKDGSMVVKEEITVQSCGIKIRHGILREFPTVYEDKWGTKYIVNFTIKEVLANGKPIDYFVQSKRNGKYIYIGNQQRYLPRGMYTFTIVYTTNRQLGFFEQHDELYWNVTGNGWRLPIDKVHARVRLPEGIDISEINIDAFTGFYGDEGKHFEGYVARNGTAQFTTTRNFAPYEGLSIVVGWPKGHIYYPGMLQKFVWFLHDNITLGIWGIFLLFVLFLFSYVYRKNKRIEGNDPIIPLFYPPVDMTPGVVNYVVNQGYKDTAFAAEIVNMAVHGWLEIKYTAGGFFVGDFYTLIKKHSDGIEHYPMYKAIYDRLFAAGDEFKIGVGTYETLERVRAILSNNYTQYSRLFEFNSIFVTIGVVGFMCAVGLIVILGDVGPLITLAIFASVALLMFAYRLLMSYTKEGFQVKREIDGFKLFLQTTEKERMEMIGTSPTKTPELYEKYLPYAMALGVEKQWNRQFVPIFEELKQDGHAYVPMWYVGPRMHDFSSSALGSHLSHNLSSAISSAFTPSGRSSGFGGRSSGGGGFSGGGGGGGGGGGW